MSTEPAREEAWNCNRCRDRRVIVWNGVATPCDRCAPTLVIGNADYRKSMAIVAGILDDLGSLPLQGTEATDSGGAGAGSVGGPSHDTGGAA